MSVDDFIRYSGTLHRLTVDFIRVVPDARWDYTPDPPGRAGQPKSDHRIGRGFAPFRKQVRHLVCVRGVYNDALRNRWVDWARKHDHHTGPLTREALLAGLEDQQGTLLDVLRDVDVQAPIDWGGTPFPFPYFTWEWVQHEAIHHGQWSLYASLGGFETPLSWRTSWGL